MCITGGCEIRYRGEGGETEFLHDLTQLSQRQLSVMTMQLTQRTNFGNGTDGDHALCEAG